MTDDGRRRLAVGPAVLVFGVIIVAGLLGPLLAPYDPAAPLGPPFSGPGPDTWLGTDALGRDVLSRLMSGAPGVLITSLVGTAVASALGVAAGLAAAVLRLRRGLGGALRPLDALLAVPPVVVVVLVLTALPDRAGVVIAIAATSAPLTARIVHAVALDVGRRPYVELAVARGERLPWLLGRELLPLVRGVVLADAGLRFVLAVYLVTAAGFLGIGIGDTDWGALIVDALPGATLQPVALAAPLILVIALTVSVNLVADAAMRRATRRWV